MVINMNRFFNNTTGSITIEAAAVFPVFLVFMLLMINFINIAAVYIGMDHAVSETAKLIAANAYPIQSLQRNITADGDTPGTTIPTGSDISADIAGKVLDQGSSLAVEAVIKGVARNKIREFYPLSNIAQTDFAITRMKINEDVVLTVNYSIKMPVPFFSVNKIGLSNTAVERAWVDG